MKKILFFVVSFLSIFILTGCSGSSKITGKWHVTDPNETSAILKIEKNSLILDGQKMKYTQNGTGINKKTKYYVLKMEESQKLFSIIFPEGKKMKQSCYKLTILMNPIKGKWYLR
ncbi:hypothetical protein ACXZ8K_04625 [Streptococcus agalactiae]|uniref:hypothetical protein n=1 Tax=Streptococcus agalactiae TaxID=1311 RepID=UPI0002E32A0C|nr:hypothetical protein [Streptococcus agalactiae]ODG95334.1 hypothetical protein TH70_0139 [Streptococcus agalactiae]